MQRYYNTVLLTSIGIYKSNCICKVRPISRSLHFVNHNSNKNLLLKFLKPKVIKRPISQSFYESYLSLDTFPVKCAYIFLDGLHLYTGLPWWATILSATFVLRTTVTLPLFILTIKNNEKLSKLTPLIGNLSKELKTEISKAQKELGWDARMAYLQYKSNMKRIVDKLYIQENCHPAKSIILPWVQLPIWVSTSLALRNMSGMFQVDGNVVPAICPDLATEGTLWFTNFLVPDMIFLPLIIFASNTIIVEMYRRRVPNPSKFHKILTYAFRGMNVIMLPIAASVPSCLSFYWACSSVYGLVQNIIIGALYTKTKQVQTNSASDKDEQKKISTKPNND